MSFTNQSIITDYFNAISTQRISKKKSSQRKVKGGLKCSSDKFESKLKETALTTPKRPAKNVTSKTSTAKKRRLLENDDEISTDTKLLRREKHSIGVGPIRKLDFSDCIGKSDKSSAFLEFLQSKDNNNNNNNNDNNNNSSINELNKPVLHAIEVKERLKSCKNRLELKQRLASINNCVEKLKQFTDKTVDFQAKSPIKSPAKSPAKTSPWKYRSPIKKVILSPVKTPPCKTPNLSFKSPVKNKTQSDDAESELTLPIEFAYMLKIFKVIDYNCWRLFKRNEVSTFDKLKQVVEHSTHRTFTLDMLLKILTIDKNTPKFILSWESYSGQLKLVITPKYKDTIYCLNSLGVLNERENDFRSSLINITKIEHLKFLSKMNLQLPANSTLYRWHPLFKLDSVKDIKPDFTLLPNKPQDKKPKNTILDYFNNIKSDNKETNTVECSNSDKNNNKKEPEVIKTGILKGISVELFNKIRAKEAAKLAKLMKRPPEIDKEILTVSKLSDIVNTIYDCFMDDQTLHLIEYENIVKRISESIMMSINETRRHLEYLSNFEVTGKKWLEIIPLRNTTYVKIDRTYPLTNLYSAIREKLSQLQNS